MLIKSYYYSLFTSYNKYRRYIAKRTDGRFSERHREDIEFNVHGRRDINCERCGRDAGNAEELCKIFTKKRLNFKCRKIKNNDF